MVKIISPRGTGKTLKLIQISSEKQIPILCFSSRERENIMRRAIFNRYKIPRPILFPIETLGQGEKEVLVDDIEKMAKMLLYEKGFILKGYTLNKKDLEEELYEL